MVRLHPGQGKAVMGNRSTGIAGVEVLDTLVAQPTGKVGIGDDDSTGLFGDLDGVADVIGMTMRQCYMRNTIDRTLALIIVKGRITGEEWIDEYLPSCRLDRKGRMPVPGDFHHSTPYCNCFRINHRTIMADGNIITLEELLERHPSGGRLMGLDLGSKTIGLSISDSQMRISSMMKTLKRAKFSEDAQALLNYAERNDVIAFVIGMPLNMDGSEGPRAQSTRAFIRNFGRLNALPFILQDERLSTYAAEQAMLEADVSRKKRKKRIDAVAATIILQGALDRIVQLRTNSRPANPDSSTR
jgi:putative holliday junction resolvase